MNNFYLTAQIWFVGCIVANSWASPVMFVMAIFCTLVGVHMDVEERAKAKENLKRLDDLLERLKTDSQQ